MQGGTETHPKTTYDLQGDQYKVVSQKPIRKDIEEYTVLHLVGDLNGKKVLDLGCGEGYFSRVAKMKGASRVVGVDISSKMIELASKEEELHPLGIEYIVGDALDLPKIGDFDIVLTVYLFGYASSMKLPDMCESVSRNLKKGGKCIGVMANSEGDPKHWEYTKQVGLKFELLSKKEGGDDFSFAFIFTNPPIVVHFCRHTRSSFEKALQSSNFAHPVKWSPPLVDLSLTEEQKLFYSPLVDENTTCYSYYTVEK